MKKKIFVDEQTFFKVLLDSLKESYPTATVETIKTQAELIKNGSAPTNIIGMFIQEDVRKYYGMKVEEEEN